MKGKKGKLYGIGIGPGDPELITVKAKRILNEVPVIFVPVKDAGGDSTALSIISKIIDTGGKSIMDVVFSMEGGREDFLACGRTAASVVTGVLDSGRDAAMITLGDVSLYSTYMYLNGYIREGGYETEIIPGITSFSNASALTGIPLAMGDEGLAVIPASLMHHADTLLRCLGNVAVMKAGGIMNEILELLDERGVPPENATVVSRAGMDGEYIGQIDAKRHFSYFTTVLIKR